MSGEAAKTKILVTFIQTHIGGAMTSLVNFLNALNLEKYEVDVLFYSNDKGGRWGIKDGINILPYAKTHKKLSVKNILGKVLYPPYIIAKLREYYYLHIEKNKIKSVSVIAREGCRYSRRIEKEYDIALSYEFSWCMYYTERYVKAKKKFLWHHLDYDAAGMNFKMDKKTFGKFDRMVFVSEEVMRKFTSLHPEYKKSAVFMPNLLSSEYVRKKGEEEVERVFEMDEDVTVNMISVARIRFDHKGYDRGIEIFKRLREEGLIDKIRWIVIGDGKDTEEFVRLIEENKLEDYIKYLGKKENPIPYMKQSEVLFLPSRFEGKPMVVTEAMIMGLMPLVSRYASADEQISSGIDGIVTDNNTDALYMAVKDIILKPEKISEIRENIKKNDYGNTDEIAVFDEIIRN